MSSSLDLILEGPNSCPSLLTSQGPPQPAYSYYPEDEFQHFYKWTSPPGILKIMSIMVIVMCVAIFACVASTLAWDSQGAMSGFGYGGGTYGGGTYGAGGYGGGTYYGNNYGAGTNYGYSGLGGNYNDPRKGKGFMIAMAAITFIVALAVFIIIVSHQSLSESRRFYLAVIIICAILALLMLIATIVYLVAVNPMAQSSGSMYGNQIASLCAQYQQPQASVGFVNQYLYHYCVVEPQEVITRQTSAFFFFSVFFASGRDREVTRCFSFYISGHCHRVRLPGHRRSDYHARLCAEDPPEDPGLRQEQHPVEESQGDR